MATRDRRRAAAARADAGLLNQGVPASALQENALYTGGQYTDSQGNTVNFNPAVNNQAFFHILFQTAAVNGNYNALQARMTERWAAFH